MTPSDSVGPYRVLLVAPSPPPYGGMALQARLLEKLLRRDGNSVVFFASNFELPGALRIFERLPGIRTLLRALAIWAKLWRETRCVEVVHVLAASWLYFFVVVCPAVLVGRIRGARVVLNYRGGGAEPFFRWTGWVVGPVFRLAGAVTAPSEFLADVIGRHFHIPVAIVPNILEHSNFQYRQRAAVQPRLLVTRHLEKIYDIESVIRAFHIVQDHYPEATLWIAGTGTQEEYLRGLVSAWKLHSVRFLGHVAHNELAALCNECDIFVNASRVDNFPGALLEASAAGLVVVSTGAGGIPYIYQHEKNALLVEPGDWKALAREVERVIESPQLALKLANEAVVMARGCEWREVRKSLYKAYGVSSKEDLCTAG